MENKYVANSDSLSGLRASVKRPDFSLSLRLSPRVSFATCGSACPHVLGFLLACLQHSPASCTSYSTAKLDSIEAEQSCDIGMECDDDQERPSTPMEDGSDDDEGWVQVFSPPTTVLLRTQNALTYCHACGVQGRKVRKCSGCSVACYCSKECQKSAWPIHK